MKTILLTGFDEVMRPIGELTLPLMQSYAERHGLQWGAFYTVTPGQPAYWEKVPHVISALKHYDRVIWLDADQMITNPNFDLAERFTGGFHASKDWGADATEDSHFSMCGFVCHRDSLPLFEWLEANKADWIGKPFPEQAPMRYLFKCSQDDPLFKESVLKNARMYVWHRRLFNAVPIEVHPTVKEPWQLADWCAHLTMLPVPERVQLFHKIKKKLC
jgi:hypothetical protein